MAPSTNSSVVIVIPCFNEEHRLPKDQFIEFAREAGSVQFLFVDDGSADGTYKVLQALQNGNPEKFKVLKLDRNSGKAEAVRRGLLKAAELKPEFVGYWDADLATPLRILPLLLAWFQERPGVEMILGSRIKLLGFDIERNELRHYLGRAFATAASLALGISIYDTQCGAKLFRNTPGFSELIQNPFHSRWIFDVELLARYLKKVGRYEAKHRINEFPLPIWHHMGGSKVRPTDFFKALWELFHIYLSYR